MATEERIIELYLSETGLSLRYLGVAERLGADPDEIRQSLRELVNKGVMFMQRGYYQRNPLFLWKDPVLFEKYGKRTIEGDFLK